VRIVNLEGLYFVQALREFGHEVLSVGQTEGCDLRLDSPMTAGTLWELLAGRGFVPDVALWCDLCRPPVVLGLESLPVVTIGYSIDQYCNPWHVPLSAGFDLFYVAQKDYLPLFADPRLAGRGLEWLPLFCDPNGDADPGCERDIPVSFVGTLDPPLNPGRKPFLEGFRRLAPLVVLTGDYRPVFGRSRIVLNQSAVSELNFRIFQAMSCGAALLTEACDNGLAELFTPGEELFTYVRGDCAGAAAIAQRALSDGSWARVAASGMQKVRELHSSTARGRQIARAAEALLREGPARWRLANPAVVREETSRAFAMLAADLALPLPIELRALYAGQSARLLKD
jgi:hypothetical protein